MTDIMTDRGGGQLLPNEAQILDGVLPAASDSVCAPV